MMKLQHAAESTAAAVVKLAVMLLIVLDVTTLLPVNK